MENQEKKAISELFDKKYSFTDEETFFIQNSLNKTPDDYVQELLISAQTPYREKIELEDGQLIVIKHFTTDEKNKGINFVVLHKFYESKPLLKKFSSFSEAHEFYHLIINYITNPELLYEDDILQKA